jgi:hypothetical protein
LTATIPIIEGASENIPPSFTQVYQASLCNRADPPAPLHHRFPTKLSLFGCTIREHTVPQLCGT